VNVRNQTSRDIVVASIAIVVERIYDPCKGTPCIVRAYSSYAIPPRMSTNPPQGHGVVEAHSSITVDLTPSGVETNQNNAFNPWTHEVGLRVLLGYYSSRSGIGSIWPVVSNTLWRSMVAD